MHTYDIKIALDMNTFTGAFTKENRRLAEAWAYINGGVTRGLWYKSDFEDYSNENIILMSENVQAFEKKMKGWGKI